MNINESYLIFGFLKKFLYNGVMFDVGAHVGGSLRPFAENGWNIHAFEPEDNNNHELTELFSSHKNVVINKLAVADKPGKLKFYVSEKHWGIHSLKPFDSSHKKVVEVKVIKLSDYVEKNKIINIDFLKIDVEGADYLVLKGMDFSKVTPKVVMVEYMDSRTEKHFGYRHHKMAELLQRNDYVVFMFNWSKIVGGYGEKGVTKNSTEFVNFEKYPSTQPLYWGNLVGVKSKFAIPFYFYIRYQLFLLKMKTRWAK